MVTEESLKSFPNFSTSCGERESRKRIGREAEIKR